MGSAAMQGELWGRRSAVWAEGNERRMRPLFEHTLDALEPLVDRTVLDAGCGSGLAVRLTADRGARAEGLDASEGMLDVARSRSPEAVFVRGDLEELPYEDGRFDVVTAFNSVQYAGDPIAAVAELRRVTRPSGRVAIGIWGDPARCETDALFSRLGSLVAPAPGASSPDAPLGLSAPGVLEEVLEAAGLRVETGGEVAIPLEYRDIESAWEEHAAAGPLQQLMDAVGPEPVKRVLVDVLEADRKPDGALRQDNVMRFVIAARTS